MPTVRATSLRRISGSAAMQARTWAWLVKNRKRRGFSSELDFISPVTVVLSLVSEITLYSKTQGGLGHELAQSCRPRRSVERGALEDRCRGVGRLRSCRDRAWHYGRYAQVVVVGAVDR